MAWHVEFTETANRQLDELDAQRSKRILKFIQKLTRLENPRTLGEALDGPRFGEFWKYRVGDYRLICKIEDDRLIVFVVKIGHRRQVYR